MRLEERAQHSLLQSRVRRADAKTARRARRLASIFGALAGVGAGLIIWQIVSADPIPVVVIAGILLILPFASIKS